MEKIKKIQVGDATYEIEDPSKTGKKTAEGGEVFNDYESNQAKGSFSHTQGQGTLAQNQAEHAQGLYNRSNTGTSDGDRTIHSIGIGTSGSDRKNAVEVMRNGDTYIKGIGGYDGTNPSAAETLPAVMDGKVDKVSGKGLSTNDYTDSEKQKVADAQPKLVSGTNIKTVNGQSLLGSGDVEINSAPDLSNYLSKTEQTLTDEEKAQVQENIGVKDVLAFQKTAEGGFIGGDPDVINAEDASLAFGESDDDSPDERSEIGGTGKSLAFGYCVAGGKIKASDASLAFGSQSFLAETKAVGNSLAHGYGNACPIEASNSSHAFGYSDGLIKATGTGSLAHGYGVIEATGTGACAFGSHLNVARASGEGSIAGGYNSGEGIIAEGKGAIAIGYASSGGVIAKGDASVALGCDTQAVKFCEVAIGKYNSPNEEASSSYFDVNDHAFSIGNGDNNEYRSNAFKVLFNGTVYADNTTIQPMADYAEMFEWADGNPDNEDRVGYFVALSGKKIAKATSESAVIVGVISGAPCIIGDAPMRWHDKYLNDEWGRPIYETKTWEVKKKVLVKDEDGQPVRDADGKSTFQEVTETKQVYVRKLNPNYDPQAKYVPREQRKEWSAVGLLGKLLVRQDGTLEAGSFCKPNDNGVATKANSGYYVLEVINASQARILVK